MTDHIQTIRDDLAFMKALASDDGRLPAAVGAHLLAGGLIFGVPIFPVWATLRGLLDLPHGWTGWVSLISTAFYIPVFFLIMLRQRKQGRLRSVEAFGAIWSSVGLTTVAILAVIFTAAARLHLPQIWQLWPAACFALYGAAWWSVGMVRRSWGLRLVALGSYATAVINGFLIGTPDLLLGCAVGILAWIAAPGFVLLLKAPRTAA
jgi:hypothetical protein